MSCLAPQIVQFQPKVLRMSGTVILSAAFIGLSLVFWFLQLRTSFLSTRYYLQVSGLFLIGVTAAYMAYSIAVSQQYWAQTILAVLIAIFAVYHFVLLWIRLTSESDGKYRW